VRHSSQDTQWCKCVRVFQDIDSPPIDRGAGATLTSRKLGILNFVAAAGVAPTEVLLHYLVAACDPTEAVARRGEELMRKRCAVGSHRPSVDLEDAVLVGPESTASIFS
jgi:Proteasome stabiliser